MVLEFYELKYHGKLDFAKLEYPKSGSSLHISEIVVDCNIVCKKVLLAIFTAKFVLFIDLIQDTTPYPGAKKNILT